MDQPLRSIDPPAGRAGPGPAVRGRGLTRRYRRITALDGVDLEVHRGEFFGLIGPDGAGKSTLLQGIAGVLRLEGSLEVMGQDLRGDAATERAKLSIGFMPQGIGLNLYPDLTVDENLDYLADLRLLPADVREASKTRLLEMTQLTPFRSRPAGKLSGGMKQKLGLCGALMGEPRLLVLDEPTTGVDPISRREFWEILTGLVLDQGLTAIVSTSYLDEAERMERLAFVYGGRILSLGTPRQVREAVPTALHEFRPAGLSRAMAALDRASIHFTRRGDRLRVPLGGGDERLGPLREALAPEVEPLDPRPALEDVFAARVAEESGGLPRYLPFPAGPMAGGERGDSIEAENLTRRFGDFTAVDRLTFRVRRGEIFGLLGPNGSGKTTALKMICGLLPPSGGEARVAGFAVEKGGAALRRRLGYMSQLFSLYRDLTVLENLSLYASIYGVGAAEREARVRWAIEQADLRGREGMRAGSLPLGERQRLALGCATLHAPEVLLLDEPTSGVDPIARDAFWRMIRDLAGRVGVTVLVTTHYLSEAEACERLALLDAGRLVALGSPADLRTAAASRRGDPLIVECDRYREALQTLRGAGLQATLFGRDIHVLTLDPGQARARIEAALGAASIEARLRQGEISLENAFIAHVEAARADQEAA